ncbi:MAG: primosomal protein N' [Oscillospiraceae bacterium]|nr:primosomal protein N' [Oscillospiraceae bacterium]
MSVGLILDIAVSGTVYGYDKLYSYKLPSDVNGDNIKGKRVLVPFGNGNRKRVALVVNTREGELSKLKPITSVIDETPLLSEEMLCLLLWLKETTLCTYFDALRCLIPSALSVNFERKYQLAENVPDDIILTEEENNLLSSLKSSKNQKEFDLLLDTSSNPSKKNVVNSLIDKDVIIELDRVKRKIKDNTLTTFRLSEEYLSGEIKSELTPKQKKVAEVLSENECASAKELCYLCNISETTVKNMLKKGILTEYEYEVILPSDAVATENPKDIILSPEQQNAFSEISSKIDENKPAGALLFGVTGSGKTSVFIKLIEYTLSKGKNVILLIPQISLTPQTVNRFQSLFGDTVAVLHSNLSLSQRMNEYKRIQNGDAKIVIGTRSAVFAPLKNIGLIIMDEEDERTYKSEMSPRYHARDVAIKRCGIHNSVLVMASATPSVESFYFAEENRFSLIKMKDRYTGSVLPDVKIVDMGDEMSSGNISNFSDTLCEEINYNLEHGEQTILLLNRRGYHTYISCPVCREPLSCPNCNIPMTYHKTNGTVICHYCGYQKPFEEKCEACGHDHMKKMGLGTQKVEDELSELFPDARILRMDTDTTYSRYSYETKFKEFSEGKYDIMIGTQMIAKGLDFPNVTLVGVISVDKALFSGDFRGYERTFSLITQVVGRSGRGEKHGRAILQTFVPDHYVLNLAADQDYEGFYKQEISVRKALIYPPFCDICVVGFSSLIEKDAENATKIFADEMARQLSEITPDFPMRVLGPSKAILGRINGKYRYKLIIKTKNTKCFREYISKVYSRMFEYKNFSNVSIYVDINGDIGL